MSDYDDDNLDPSLATDEDNFDDEDLLKKDLHDAGDFDDIGLDPDMLSDEDSL